ncbi:MAG TPA: P22 phage major capsid protein family protein, partial [Rhodopila sp.]|nr:P22 phage major capsid protein family protein [Rhodopila sp.]
MANSLLTLNMITREAIRLYRNSNAFLMNVDRQYDDQFERVGAKIGNTLRVRYPNDFTVTTSGVTAVPQNTNEQYTNLTLSRQDHVDLTYSSQDLSLSLDDF